MARDAHEIPDTIGTYHVEKEVASGGMGRVFAARDDDLHRTVAIKLIRPERLESPRAAERFQREARTVAGLDHVNIVRIHHFFRWQGQQAIVMEYVEGRTLRDLVAEGPLAMADALDYGLQVARGLAVAHGAGFVHRDLKSDNVMVTPEGRVKILDFGLAKPTVTTPGEEVTMSRDGAVLGTPHTMSPEQAAGERVDHRTDLFAFGVLLYELTTGRSPFLGENLRETVAKVLTARQAPAVSLNAAIPPRLSALIDRLLVKDPRHRPSGIAEVTTELEAVAASQVPGSPGTPDAPKPVPAPDDAMAEDVSELETWIENPSPLETASAQRAVAALLAVMVLSAGTLLVFKLALPSSTRDSTATRPGSAAGLPGAAPPCASFVVTQELDDGVTLRWRRLCPESPDEVKSPFFLGVAPVEARQFLALSLDSSSPPGVVHVERAAAESFCSRLGGSLPTMSQWHWAMARSGELGLSIDGEEWTSVSGTSASRTAASGDGAPLPFRCVLGQAPAQIGQ